MAITTKPEAHAVNILANHLLGEPNHLGERATDDEVRDALALLADSAYRKLIAGVDGRHVSEKWHKMHPPLPVARLVGSEVQCPLCGGEVQQLEQVDHFNTLVVRNGIVHRSIDTGGLGYEDIPRSFVCRNCVTEVVLPLPLRDEV